MSTESQSNDPELNPDGDSPDQTAAGSNSSHSPRTYYVVFVVLMLLLVATVVLDRFDLGALNTWLAMGISVAKAMLILWFFMHLRGPVVLLRIVMLTALMWLALAISLTMADFTTRGWNDPEPTALRPAVRADNKELRPAKTIGD